MKSFEIRDLAADKELDREAMAEIRGGLFEGVDILSPDFFNFVTPITGAASVPTAQTNKLVQADTTVATNGYGINYVSNNKYADQSNYNSISDFLNPIVGSPVV